MNKYIDLWSKKNEYVSKLEPKLAEAKEEKRMLDQEERKLNETRINSERELHKLEKYDEENTRKAMLILEMVLVGVFSLFSIPLLIHLNLSVLASILLMIAANAANVGIVVTIREALARYYQEFREHNKHDIAIEKLTINSTKKNMQENYMARVAARKKEDELLLEIEQTKKEISKLGNAILEALAKQNEDNLGLQNEILDKFIADELASKEEKVIDINMKKERTLNK